MVLTYKYASDFAELVLRALFLGLLTPLLKLISLYIIYIMRQIYVALEVFPY